MQFSFYIANSIISPSLKLENFGSKNAPDVFSNAQNPGEHPQTPPLY